MDNYKGLYYKDKKEKKFYEHGAHFKYKQLYKKLKDLGGIVEDVPISISINQNNNNFNCDNNKYFINKNNQPNDKKLKINLDKISFNNEHIISKTRNKKENIFENSSYKLLSIPNNSYSNKNLNLKLNEKNFTFLNQNNSENKILNNNNNIHKNNLKTFFNNRNNSMKKIISRNDNNDKIYSNRLLVSKANDNINILYSIRNNNKLINNNLSQRNQNNNNNINIYCKSEDSKNTKSLFYLKTNDFKNEMKNIYKSKENILNRNFFFYKGNSIKKHKTNKNLFNVNLTDNLIKKQLNEFNISTNLKNKNMLGINRINLINKMNNLSNKFLFHNNKFFVFNNKYDK